MLRSKANIYIIISFIRVDIIIAIFRDHFATAKLRTREMFMQCKLGCPKAVAITKLEPMEKKTISQK